MQRGHGESLGELPGARLRRISSISPLRPPPSAHDALIDRLASEGIAYISFFPLGGFTPLQSDALTSVAARLSATPMAVALGWLLPRSPNILLIPGTSSVAHLRENIAGAVLTLSEADLRELDQIAGRSAVTS